MEPPFESVAVANWFVDKASENGRGVTLMKLLKLVYFAHGWHLGLTGKPLIKEEIQAWKFGPVAPEVYHDFKENGSSEIVSPAATITSGWDEPLKFGIPRIKENPSIEQFLGKIWDIYGGLSAYQLSQLTHQSDTPWYTVWYEQGAMSRKGVGIPDGLIENYFKKKVKGQNG